MFLGMVKALELKKHDMCILKVKGLQLETFMSDVFLEFCVRMM